MPTHSDYRTQPRLLLVMPLVVAWCCLLAGCHEYHWRLDYEQAEQDARAQGRYLFIFYKWWAGTDSNRMHSEVLNDAAVASLFRDTVNVLLEKETCPDAARYLSKFAASAPPTFIVVAPDGTFQTRSGYIPKDRFIEFIRTAKTPRPQRTVPRRPPPPPGVARPS